MNIEYLYYFIEAARCRNISKAALRYNISQQGLSRAIKRIEAECHVTLFERSGNAISLTPAGQVFYDYATEVCGAFDLLEEKISQFSTWQKESRNSMTVFLTLNLAQNIWSFISNEAEASFPETKLLVIELMLEDIIETIATNDEADQIALVSVPEPLHSCFVNSDVGFVKAMDIELMAKVCKSSHLAKRLAITTEDLRTYDLVYPRDPALDLMVEDLTGLSTSHIDNIMVRTSSQSIINRRLMDNNTIGFSNTFCLHYDIESDFKILPIKDTLKTPVYIIWNKSRCDLQQNCEAFAALIAKNHPKVAPKERELNGCNESLVH